MPLDVIPAINFLLLLVLFVYVYRKSAHWTGLSQDARLQIVEAELDHSRRRLLQLEQSSQHMLRDYLTTNEAILREIRQLATSVGELGRLSERVTILEEHRADVEQEIQFVKDLGCGYPDCPRMKRIAGAPGAAAGPEGGER
jgi:hypothetical protein